MTRSAALHAAAWKRAFDDFLRERGRETIDPLAPFDLGADYLRHVDGRPYDQAIRTFLASRDIDLPDHAPMDRPGAWSVASLADRKDRYLLEQVRRYGVSATPNIAALVGWLRRRGVATAAVSAGHNGTTMLRAAGVADLFDVSVDGVRPFQESGGLGPDLFLEATRRLGLPPEWCAVVDDTPLGVSAGRVVGFGVVIGVEDFGRSRDLYRDGADVVVGDLDEVRGAVLEPLPEPRSPGDGGLPAREPEPPV